jgi:hypothetical protein
MFFWFFAVSHVTSILNYALSSYYNCPYKVKPDYTAEGFLAQITYFSGTNSIMSPGWQLKYPHIFSMVSPETCSFLANLARVFVASPTFSHKSESGS